MFTHTHTHCNRQQLLANRFPFLSKHVNKIYTKLGVDFFYHSNQPLRTLGRPTAISLWGTIQYNIRLTKISSAKWLSWKKCVCKCVFVYMCVCVFVCVCLLVGGEEEGGEKRERMWERKTEERVRMLHSIMHQTTSVHSSVHGCKWRNSLNFMVSNDIMNISCHLLTSPKHSFLPVSTNVPCN